MTFFFKKEQGPKTATYLVVVFVLATVVVMLTPRSPGKAETVSLFPATCVGGWSGVAHAARAPDLPDDAGDAFFTPVNSAVFTNGREQILCAGFEGDLADDAVVLATRLRLAWRLKDAFGAEPEPAIMPVAVEEPSAETPEEGTIDATDADADTDVVLSSDFIDDGSSEPMPETAPTEVVEADDVSPATASSPIEPAPGSFEIRYSIDGIEWKSLGLFPRRALPASVDLPALSPASLAELRISIEPDSDQVVGDLYLESLALEAAYDPAAPPEEPDVPEMAAETEAATGTAALPEAEDVVRSEEFPGSSIVASRMDSDGWRIVVDGRGRSRGGFVVPDATLVLFPAGTEARRGAEEDGWQFLERPSEGDYYAQDLVFGSASADICIVGAGEDCAFAPEAFRAGDYVIEIIFRDGNGPVRDAQQFKAPAFAAKP